MNEPVYSVLVADDVAALRRLIKLSLQSSGRFNVVAEAPSGASAIALAREHHPDLVLLDLSMPEMDGLEALPQILRESAEARVVVFSGFNHVRMAPVAIRLGASAYVEKGLEPEQLVQRLLSVLEAPAPDKTGPETPNEGNGLPPHPPKREDNGKTSSEAAPTPRFLCLTDSAELVERVRRAATHGSVEHARTLAAALEKLEHSTFDLVLADPSKAEPAARTDLIDLLSHTPRTPVVLLVDSPDSDVALLGFKLGVEDCLPRDDIDARLLQRSLLYAIERRRGHEARQVARQQALEVRRIKEVEALKTQFFNSAAHELNTPLTPIKLQLHLLKSAEQEFKPEHRRSLQILDRNVDRLARLTEELLNVARLQAGRLRLDPQWVDLYGVIREVAETFDAVALAQGVQLEARVDKSTLVHADPKGLAQVLYNLISNAIKFTARGGRVAVESVETGSDVTVLVHDSGIGFTSEQAAQLFQPFSRAHEEVSPGMGGTGLGLFVAKGVVELHGGRIWCESPGPGRGSTFAFSLPVSTPHELAAAGKSMGLRGSHMESPVGVKPT